MMYAANPSTRAVRDHMTAGRLICMTTPAQGNRIPDDALVILDNGVYGKGFPGEAAWLTWLENNTHLADRALFAVAPDVVGNALETLERSAPFLPMIRELGFPAAFAAQDGAELPGMVPWDDLDCLFIGGTTAWKMGPHILRLVAEAKRRRKWVHAGRVNSARRFAHFELMGADSADGTFVAFGPDVNLPKVLDWTFSLFGEGLPA